MADLPDLNPGWLAYCRGLEQENEALRAVLVDVMSHDHDRQHEGWKRARALLAGEG